MISVHINILFSVKGLRAQLEEVRGRHRYKELLDLEKKDQRVGC